MAIAENRPSTMAALIDASRRRALDDDDVALLAERLAASGATLTRRTGAADLASTGGPASLSTLLGPLHLRARGRSVPKLGVPGRPAGGIDVLATIPGFNPRLAVDEVRDALDTSGYVHLLADDRWTPLDRTLFRYRQENGAQAIPPLVVASLLSKKLAAGLTHVGLEVRVAPHGNFGADLSSATINANLYNRVARMLGLTPVCLLTDARRPYQPWIGRGEALVAIADVLSGNADAWLGEHAALCARMAAETVDEAGTDMKASALIDAQRALLAVHGTDWEAMCGRADEVRTELRASVFAYRDGAVDYNMHGIRQLLVDRQLTQATPANPFPDPAGVVLLVRPGERIVAGSPVMSVRPASDHALSAALAKCIEIHEPAPATPRTAVLLRVVRD